MKKYYFLSFFSLLVFICSCKTTYTKRDYALLSNKNSWSHDYAFGSPSWDAFERFPNNPVYTGRKGMEWPVNGFLFSDPMSVNWYLYIGEYKENYRVDQDTSNQDFNCVIYKSADRGKTWNKIGDLFPANLLCYDSIKIQAPDVMVTYSSGKYHMVFDWVSNHFNWNNAKLSGIGYAVADRPEGPFVVSKDPVKINTQFKQNPLLNRYWRMYAPMIVRRKNDWLLAYMMDTSPAPSSWVLAVSTASQPEGPYSNAEIMLNVEKKTNYPPLMEYYPAFTQDGYVYFPATSVSINRNYQSIYRVKTEEATYADKYELFSAGSLWHSLNVENEYAGIWGQTFTGFIDHNDSIYLMFPSKDSNNYGTINLARASWKRLQRQKGFNLTANEGNSFSYIKNPTDVESIDMEFKLDGTMHLIWDFHSPLDILNGWGKFSLEQSDAVYKEIEIKKTGWKIKVFERGRPTRIIDSGKIENLSINKNNLSLKKANGKYILSINNEKCWEGALQNNPGIVGLSLDPHSYLYVDRFGVYGRRTKGFVTYGFYRALVDAGNQNSDWGFKKDTNFLYGKGVISQKDSSFAKWNFDGKGFELFSPKGPLFGTINIYLDGELLKNISLKSPREMKSSSIFKLSGLSMGRHAVYIKSLDSLLPVDCINIEL
jgi:hypothetical protein